MEFKLYCIGYDGHVEKRHDCSASEDLDALDQARKIGGPHGVEVWDRARFVGRVTADGNVSEVLPASGPHPEKSI
jgi:hypothetical protein